MSQDPEKSIDMPVDKDTPQASSGQQDLKTEQSNSQNTSRNHSPEPEAPKAPYNPWTDVASFPDGGLRAWLTVAGASAGFFVSWGWINCVGVFQEYYMSHQLSDYSASTVAWISSILPFCMLICGPFAGKIFDDYGPTHLLVFGSFLHVFGLMMASISKEYYQFILSQSICSAIGASCVFTACVASVPTWFFKKRGMAIGLAAAGSSLGGVLFPVIVTRMITRTSFGWTMRTCAFLVLGLCIFATLTVRSRLPPTKRPVELMAFVRPWRETSFLITGLAMFFFYLGMFPIFAFITVIANGRGMSLQLSQYLVAVLNAGSVFGRTLPGILGDKIGRFNVMNVFCLFTTALILALWIPADTNVGSLVFAPLFGFGSGAAIGLTPALIAQISPLQEIGVRTGGMFAVGSIGALAGAPIGGALIARNHGAFLYLQLFSGCTCLLGCIFFVLARIKVGGLSLTKKV